MSDETMTIEQAAKVLVDAIALGRFAEREMERVLLQGRAEPTASMAGAPPATASVEEAAREAWDQVNIGVMAGMPAWDRVDPLLREVYLKIFRRFANLCNELGVNP